MRYRLLDHSGNVFVLPDRPAFEDHFLGKNPNHPVGGIVRLKDNFYEIEKYDETCSEERPENVHHELEAEWYAYLMVRQIIMRNNTLVGMMGMVLVCIWNDFFKMGLIRKDRNKKQNCWGFPYHEFC